MPRTRYGFGLFLFVPNPRTTYTLQKEITKALFDDLRKNPIESALTEIVGVRNSIAESLDNLEAWAAPEKPSVDLVHSLDGVRIVKQPLGMVLIIGMHCWLR